jgi:hypothetical protein
MGMCESVAQDFPSCRGDTRQTHLLKADLRIADLTGSLVFEGGHDALCVERPPKIDLDQMASSADAYRRRFSASSFRGMIAVTPA